MVIEQSTVSMASKHTYYRNLTQKGTNLYKAKSFDDLSGSFGNYLREPLKSESLAQRNSLGTIESLRAIRLQLLHHIFDFLRGFYINGSSGTNLDSGNIWKRTVTLEESEETSFESTGFVRCADGRMIDFGVSFSMSRSFSAVYEKLTTMNYFCTDPLVINLDTDITSVSDQKFLFDLDCDGVEENISFAGKGSGFLALDKNGDGIINDGSELFGTSSGDGFRDLAQYDSDGNGWIDEADDIFSKLRVWVKNEDGSDTLMDLKESDIGAIFLGNVRTGFSFTDVANNPDAIMRSSGMFLRESGGAGTMAHVDLITGRRPVMKTGKVMSA